MSQTNGNGHYPKAKNVLGTELQVCCTDPMTGFFRDGYCNTGPTDHGRHTVCILATEEFLEFSKEAGNDLSTPMPEYRFPGVQPGDKWCLCVDRWQEAFEAGMAPQVVLESTHENALDVVTLDDLRRFATTES